MRPVRYANLGFLGGLFVLIATCSQQPLDSEDGIKSSFTSNARTIQAETESPDGVAEEESPILDPISIEPYPNFDDGKTLHHALGSLLIESSELPGNQFHLLLPEMVGTDPTDSISLYWDWRVGWLSPEVRVVPRSDNVETYDSNNGDEMIPDEEVNSEEDTASEEEEFDIIQLPSRYGYGNRSFGLYVEAHPDPVKGKYLDLMLVYTNNSSRTQAGVWTSVRFGMNAFYGSVTASDFGDGLDLNENYYSVEHDNPYLYRVFTDIEDDQVFVKDLHYPELMRHPSLVERFPFGGYLRGTIRSDKLFQTHSYRYQRTMEHIPRHMWYQTSQVTNNNYIAVESKDGDKVLGIAWEEIYDLWFQSAYFALCLHASPYFGIVEPGQSVTRRGRIFFVSEGGYQEFKSRLEEWKEEIDPTPPDEPMEDASESVFEEVDARLRHHSCGLPATH